MLSHFIDEVNRFDGREITEEDEAQIIAQTVQQTKKVYPSVRMAAIEEDLYDMLDVLFEIAHGNAPDAELEVLSLRKYAPYMSAPHRMDLMISAMADENGRRKCNQNCLFCYAENQPMGTVPELGTEEWKNILDLLRESNVPMVTFTGGEPTMRQDLVTLVEHAKWFVTRVNTNGVRLTKALAKDLKDASLDSIQITLYSYDEEIHNELVGGKHFRETVAGIQNAVEAGLDVSVNTPLCVRNADYLKTLAFVHSLGVRFITVSGLILTGMAEQNSKQRELTSDELYAIVKDAKAFCAEHSMEMDFTSPGLLPRDRLEELDLHVPICGACLSNMAVSPDGTVIPCQSWLSAGAAS